MSRGRKPSGGAPGSVRGDERGSISILVAVVIVGLLAMVALVVDGGGKVAATISADNAAQAAARAAGQAIDTTAVMAGLPITADPAAAAAAARRSLATAGVTGQVTVEAGGRAVTVSTTGTYRPVFLGLLAGSDITVRGHARAELFQTDGRPR